ncbi:MAG TPA: molybdopterin-guanine dinucleotide biosynthesis protein B [Gemmatimonadales bacterium]|nr:molybdopterin-guanine dinucleotide biosynthesis protein B [Gemmatimonadales bacterium]
MAGPRLIAVVGKKNAGKTTLVVALVKELIRRGHRVMTIKHGSHPFEIDAKGRDTWRHMHEGGAERVVMETPNSRVLIAKPAAPLGPRELASQFLSDAHFVIVEGFKAYDLPKIEVFRREVHAEPLYAPGAPGSEQVIAIVTDDHNFRAPVPVMRFTDTAWLYRLTDIVLQGAR